jgi:hypothetical protein
VHANTPAFHRRCKSPTNFTAVSLAFSSSRQTPLTYPRACPFTWILSPTYLALPNNSQYPQPPNPFSHPSTYPQIQLTSHSLHHFSHSPNMYVLTELRRYINHVTKGSCPPNLPAVTFTSFIVLCLLHAVDSYFASKGITCYRLNSSVALFWLVVS